jgi:hypothetical protein
MVYVVVLLYVDVTVARVVVLAYKEGVVIELGAMELVGTIMLVSLLD